MFYLITLGKSLFHTNLVNILFNILVSAILPFLLWFLSSKVKRIKKKSVNLGIKQKHFHPEFAVVLMRLNAAACACAFVGEGSFFMQQKASAVNNEAEIRSSAVLRSFFLTER